MFAGFWGETLRAHLAVSERQGSGKLGLGKLRCEQVAFSFPFVGGGAGGGGGVH